MKQLCDCINGCSCKNGDLKRKFHEVWRTEGEAEQERQEQDIKKRRSEEEWYEDYSGPSEWDWETCEDHVDWELPQTTKFDIEG